MNTMSKRKPQQGIQFPVDPQTQKASSSATAKQIIQAALSVFATPESQALGSEKNWRKHYPRYFKALVREAIASAEAGLNSAAKGLEAAEQRFDFIRDQQHYRLSDAMQQIKQQPFGQFRLQGKGDAAPAEWQVPYHGQLLSGQALRDQLSLWEQKGIIEPSHAEALRSVQAHPEWFDLSNRWVVLFGAASEAGPLTWLSQWRANIVAIDLPDPKIWKKIIDRVQQGNATLIAPEYINAEGELQLGADLLKQTPEIANWLAEFDQPLDLAGVAYLDGEKHVRVSMAVIAIMKKITALQPQSSIMFMLTPTDVYAVPQRVIARMQALRQRRSQLTSLLSKWAFQLSFGHFFQANDSSLYVAKNQQQYGIADCLVLEQGPNYALAKRLQQWYALTARHQGSKVSINIAPSTTTKSVVKNPLLKAAFDGADLFGVEAFQAETTNALMAALWVYDLQCADSPANPAKPLEHPLQLISENANHGGLWSVAYLARTALPFAAIYGWAAGKLGLKK